MICFRVKITTFKKKYVVRRVALVYVFVDYFDVWLHRRAGFSHLLLHSVCSIVTWQTAPGTFHSPPFEREREWNKQITSYLIMKIVLTLSTLWKGLREPQGPSDHTLRNIALRHSNLNAQNVCRVWQCSFCIANQSFKNTPHLSCL